MADRLSQKAKWSWASTQQATDSSLCSEACHAQCAKRLERVLISSIHNCLPRYVDRHEVLRKHDGAVRLKAPWDACRKAKSPRSSGTGWQPSSIHSTAASGIPSWDVKVTACTHACATFLGQSYRPVWVRMSIMIYIIYIMFVYIYTYIWYPPKKY